VPNNITTTTDAAFSWRPDFVATAALDAVPDALVLQTSTVAGRVDGDEPTVRVPYVAADGDAGFVREGAPIPVSSPTLAECVVRTGKVADLNQFSREQFRQAGAAQRIGQSIQRAVVTKANWAYLNQPAPTADGDPAAGLLNIPDISEILTPVTNLDGLIDAIALIEEAGGTASNIVTGPLAWAALAKIKTGSGSNENLLGAGTSDIVRRVLSLPVVTTPAMPATGLLVIDKTAIVSAVGDVQTATSEHALFESDSMAVRCTWRFGQNAVRPERIVKLTVATTPGDPGETGED